MVPVAALVVLLVLPTVPAGADTLGTTNVGSNMTLTEDHDGNIVIVTDNVTLDCDGHAIKGDGVGDGINLAYRTGVTVRNCVVKGFEVGLRLQYSSDNVIEGNTANKNLKWGFIVGERSVGNVLRDNKAVLSGLDGFALFNWGTDDNQLIDNEATNNTRMGFIVGTRTANTLLEGNKARNNGSDGFQAGSVGALDGATLRNNSAAGNGGNGFTLASSTPWMAANNNHLVDNTATNNGRVGFMLANAESNDLSGNTATGNADGFAFYESARHNNLVGNRAQNNEGNGFFLGEGAVYNRLEANVASHNGFDGIHLNNADDNTFIGNEASHNKYVGFRVFDWPPAPEPSPQADGNLFESNTGCHNGELDGEDSTPRGTNKWISNEFCTTLGI